MTKAANIEVLRDSSNVLIILTKPGEGYYYGKQKEILAFEPEQAIATGQALIKLGQEIKGEQDDSSIREKSGQDS